MITEKIEALGFAKFLGKYENQSPEWHAARAGIGGSDIAAILGKSPWKSAFTLWGEKLGSLATDEEPSMAMKLGTKFEQPIRELWEEINSDWLKVHETGTWQSNANALWKANPDGIIEWEDGQLGVLEIKFTRQYWDELPEHYALQVQWYMHVLGLRKAIVVAVAGGDLKEFKVDYDNNFVNNMPTIIQFEKSLEQATAPDYDGSASTYESVRKLSPDLTDGEIELSDNYLSLLTWKNALETAENRLNYWKSVILDEMQGVKTGTYAGNVVVKLQSRGNKPFITFK